MLELKVNNFLDAGGKVQGRNDPCSCLAVEIVFAEDKIGQLLLLLKQLPDKKLVFIQLPAFLVGN